MNGDVSARTANYAAALLGETELAGGLAFPVQVPRAQLDYSLGSLSFLQQYLERVRPFANALDTQVYQNTLLAAGSYLGEVIRREVLPEAEWEMPSGGGMPILQVAGETLTPVAQIQLVLSGATGEDLPTFASNQFSFTGSAPAGDVAAADDEFDILGELDSTPPASDTSEGLELGVEAADVEELWGDFDTAEESSTPTEELVSDTPEEADDFAHWGEEASEPAHEHGLSPESSIEASATDEEQDEFGFAWDERERAAADHGDLAEPAPAAEVQDDFANLSGEDEFDFTSEPTEGANEAEAFGVEDFAAPAEQAEPELEFGSAGAWDEDDDIILDVEIVEEDEDDETMAQPDADTQAFAAPASQAETESPAEAGEFDLWSGAEPTEEFEPVEKEAPLPYAPPILPQSEVDPFSFESASNDEQELPPLESQPQELAEFGEGEDFGFDFESESAGDGGPPESSATADPVADEEESPVPSGDFDAGSLFADEAAPLDGMVREESALEEEFFGELTEEEMADDDALLGFGTSELQGEPMAENLPENAQEEAAFDPLVEPVETTQDWDPVAEEPVDSPVEPAEPLAQGATPPVLPAGPTKPPEAWDFADFFAEPDPTAAQAAEAGANWFQQFDTTPPAGTPDAEGLEATADSAAEEIAGEDDFNLDEFLPAEEATPANFSDQDATEAFAEPAEAEEAVAGESAETDEFGFESYAQPTSEQVELLDFDQPDELSSLLGVPNEDNTVIEEGTPEFAALGGEKEPSELEEDELLGEDFVAEKEAAEEEFSPFAETESESEPIPEAAASELFAETESGSAEPADEWDFAATEEAPVEEASEAFDFDLSAAEISPADVPDEGPEDTEEPAAEFDLLGEEEFPPAEPEVAAMRESPAEPADEAVESVAEASAEEEMDFGFAMVEPVTEAMEDAFDFVFEAKETADAELEFAMEEEVRSEESEAAPTFEEEAAAESTPAASEELAFDEFANVEPAVEEEPAVDFSFDEPDAEELRTQDASNDETSVGESPTSEASGDDFAFEELLDVNESAPAMEAKFDSLDEPESVPAALEPLETSDVEREESIAEEPDHEELTAEEPAGEAFSVEEFASEGLAPEKEAEPAELPPALAAQQGQLDKYLAAAASGDAQAQFELGRLYEEGLFEEDQFPEAVRRYQEAADQGHPAAMARLGHLYYLGQGVGQNWKKGVQLYLQAAKSGEPLAQYNLGMCLEHGKGVSRDMEKSLRCYYAGANAGSPACQTNLALCYLRGRGVKQQLRVGARWLAKAAEQNHGPALLLLGACYEGGVGVDQNSKEAESLYRRAAQAGYAFPAESWTIRTKHGEASAADAIDPIWWLRVAADANEPWALHNMGLCYRMGHGVRESASKTHEWFQLAAKENFAPSQYELGRCYETATGVPKDMARAAKWYTRAATAGYAPAQARLALLYDCGLGVERDPALAAKWGEK